MLYFAFGSNLYHKQMKKRCRDSVYLKCFVLKNYKLYFRNSFLGGGVADVQKRKKSLVLGALYKISKRDERKLDEYEDYPNTYIKKYFRYKGKKVDPLKFPCSVSLGGDAANQLTGNTPTQKAWSWLKNKISGKS